MKKIPLLILAIFLLSCASPQTRMPGVDKSETEDEAKKFYAIHEGKPFFKDLIKFMTSGRITVLALSYNGDAIKEFRKLIGDTDPKESLPGTIRNLYGTDIGHNAIHGADSPENAKKEILFFFPELKDKI